MYTFLQWTWGIVQTAVGAVMYLVHRRAPHFDYHGARVTVWDSIYSVSLGEYIFISGQTNPADPYFRDLLVHEYGHTIQSLILGPFYLLLVGLPSLIWNQLPYYRHKRYRTGCSYYSVLFERTANSLGAKVTGIHPFKHQR